MRSRSLVTATVIVVLGAALTLPSARASENAPDAVMAHAHADFQQAIAHAVERSQSIRQADVTLVNRANQPAMQRGYGGGGGHLMMVVSLVGMVAGVGMTYYMIKQMQKATGEASQTALRAGK